jgi:hypothetical protein
MFFFGGGEGGGGGFQREGDERIRKRRGINRKQIQIMAKNQPLAKKGRDKFAKCGLRVEK